MSVFVSVSVCVFVCLLFVGVVVVGPLLGLLPLLLQLLRRWIFEHQQCGFLRTEQTLGYDAHLRCVTCWLSRLEAMAHGWGCGLRPWPMAGVD